MSITIASRKAKARNLQILICKKIANLFGVDFNNQDEQCPIHSREMGQSGVDILLRGEIYEKFKFDIECKNCETPSIKKWINQTKKNSKKDRNWLLIWKCKDWKKPVVILDVDVFFNFFKKD